MLISTMTGPVSLSDTPNNITQQHTIALRSWFIIGDKDDNKRKTIKDASQDDTELW